MFARSATSEMKWREIEPGLQGLKDKITTKNNLKQIFIAGLQATVLQSAHDRRSVTGGVEVSHTRRTARIE